MSTRKIDRFELDMAKRDMKRKSTAEDQARLESLLAEQTALDDWHKAASRALNAFAKGPMGLTPPEVRDMPEWIRAYSEYHASFTALRMWNRAHVMDLGKLAKLRQARRGV